MVLLYFFPLLLPEMLLTQQIDANETELPSPMALKKKIILKVGKIAIIAVKFCVQLSSILENLPWSFTVERTQY